jgi:DHA1 family multidrug resistance protein-like MFS transporter
MVVLNTVLLALVLDIASPILSPGIKSIMAEFNIAQVPATLGISVYLIGIAIGPLILSTISEIPNVGRTKPYVVTLVLFTLLQIVTALVQNYPGLHVLRFL